MLLKSKILLVSMALSAGGAFAQTINISNPRLHILDSHDTVKLENKSKQKKAFKYTLYRWTQKDGYIDNNGKLFLQKSEYVPADDLQITPRTFVIMPASERSVRVSLKNKKKPEYTNYRLELEEFLLKENIEDYQQKNLQNTANGLDVKNQIALLIKLTLPVFVPKENKITPIKKMNIEYSIATYDGDKKALKITNKDTQSLKVNNIVLNGQKYQQSQFILNGVTGYVPLPNEAYNKPFVLDTNHGNINLDLK